MPKLIEKHLDLSRFDYDLHYTEYRKHAKKIAYECSRNGYDIVCAVGGDGSVHEVGTALIGSKTKLAIIPVGSGNGLARHVKIPLQPEKAIETINEENVVIMDTGLVNDKAFLGTGGFAFDAIIAKKFDKYHTRGFWGYTRLVMKEYMAYKPNLVKIELFDKTMELPVVLCTLANSSQFGNGFVVSPDSKISDGELELCLLKPFSIWEAPMVVYRFFKGTSHKLRYAQIIPFKKARITITEQLAHYDGEPFEVRKELNVEVKPKSLHILVGKTYL